MKSPARRIEAIAEAVAAYQPGADIAAIERAYMYSAKVHAGQVRKSGEPYLTHPMEVAFLLTEMRLDEAGIICGLLHDTVEDTLATLDDVAARFGDEVALLVDGVTKLSRIAFDTQEQKQAENFRKMLGAMAQDIRVILVKLADRLHNMRTLGHLPAPKRERIAQETLDIYAPLASRLGLAWVRRELEDLAFSFLQPRAHAELSASLAATAAATAARGAEIAAALAQGLAAVGIAAQVDPLPSPLWALHRRMAARGVELDQIYDAVTFRVLVEGVGRCYEALGQVHALWHPIPGRFEDFVAMPKPNRYQSLHTSVIGPGGGRIAVQIRTHEMDRVAEQGIVAQWPSRGRRRGGEVPRQEFAWLRQLLEWRHDLHDPNEFLDTVKGDLHVDEVFVFSPRGKVVALRRGATPVDFAFAIHSEVGTHCAGAKINGRLVPLRTPLRSGDMVEILTRPQQRPSADWLAFVRTGRARSKIRAIVQAEARTRALALGRELLGRELAGQRLDLAAVVADGRLTAAAAALRQPGPDALLVAVGYGQVSGQQVVEQLGPPARPAVAMPSVLGQLFRRAPRQAGRGGVVVHGPDDALVRFGRCCSPLPGDPIGGFVTRGRGITVHLASCGRALDVDPARRVAVSWDAGETSSRPVTLRVLSADRPGILALISQAFTDAGVNISQANCRVTESARAVNTFEIMVRDAAQLRSVSAEIEALEGVLTVERTCAEGHARD